MHFYDEDQPCTVMQRYNSNYGWISKDFKHKVVNLDGTVGHGSRKKSGLRVSGDELCVGNPFQLLPTDHQSAPLARDCLASHTAPVSSPGLRA